MARKAVIDSDGIVVNVIELTDGTAWTPPSGCSVVDGDGAALGGSYNSGTEQFTDPTPVTPAKTRPEEWAEAETDTAKLNLLAKQLGYIIVEEA